MKTCTLAKSIATHALAVAAGLTTTAVHTHAASVLEETSSAFSRIASEATPAVVAIRVEKTIEMSAAEQPFLFNNPFNFFGDDFMRRFFPGQGRGQSQQPRSFRQQGAGSGFLIDQEGHILSNNHVVGDADKITVRLHDGREFEAERIGTDPKSEVALIKITGDDLPHLELADSSAVKVGEWVVAIGNPFGLNETLTVGVISATGRSNLGITDYEDFIQTDAAINPGNSGGPLLNTGGEVIGINTAIYSRSGGYMGIGFAIPINMAKYVKNQLIEKGKVVRSYLGVSIQKLTPALAKSFDLEAAKGILIAQVVPNSAADDAGLKSGDVILKLDGQAVGDVGEFRNHVATEPPGTELTLTISRDGRTRQIDLTTGAYPEEQARVASEDLVGRLGLTVRNLSPELAQRFGYDADLEGVIVSQVQYQGPAALAGIRPGNVITSVNRQPVASVSDFQDALNDPRESNQVLLHVTDEQGSRFLVLDID